MMGPIKGEISMAPITTAVELTLSPMEAMKIEKMRIQRVNPLNSISFLIPSMVASGFARSMIENRSFKKLITGLIIGHRLMAALINPCGLLVFSTN
jgi:hypothetical protein